MDTCDDDEGVLAADVAPDTPVSITGDVRCAVDMNAGFSTVQTLSYSAVVVALASTGSMSSSRTIFLSGLEVSNGSGLRKMRVIAGQFRSFASSSTVRLESRAAAAATEVAVAYTSFTD
jgi:hypothetical protein